MPRSGDGLCTDCAKNLPYVNDGNILRKIGKYTCAVTFHYEGPVRDGIRALKFHGCEGRAARVAPYLAQTVAEHLAGEFDTVTYVPISFQRRIARGYDQSQLLASAAAALWGCKLEKTLRKVRNTPPQSSLKDPRQRRKNAQDAYRPLSPDRLRGKRFLLIDDVVTSGSTLETCADELLAAGAASVVCAALAGSSSKDDTTSD